VKGADRWLWIACAGVGLAAIAHAYHYLFMQDDAYIFFRYAENLIEGRGPVWNVGERVEGYTSPVWMMCMAAVRSLTGSFEVPAHVLTIGLALATLAVVFAFAADRAGSGWAGLITIGLLAADRNFAVWSTSGMETRLFGFLAIAVSYLACCRSTRTDAPLRGLLPGLGLLLLSLTRPEGLLLSALAVGFVLVNRLGRGRLGALAVSVAIWVVGVGVHLAWRLAYYGLPLPNTFYAKISGFDLGAGSAYLADFAGSYPVFTLALAGSGAWLGLRQRGPLRLGVDRYLAMLIVIYCVYLLLIGGGFMEFRMLDVLLPFAYVLIAGGIWEIARGRAGLGRILLSLELAAVLALANLWAGYRFEEMRHVVVPRSWLWDYSTRDWIVVGKWLEEIAEPGESVATTAAGAIPYFSHLPSLDMLGLNDRYVASLPDQLEGGAVGHRKLAPKAYLAQRGITFLLGHPKILNRPNPAKLSKGEFWVEIPNADPKVRRGRNFFLAVRTTGEPIQLVRSLRRRGAIVWFPRGGANGIVGPRNK